MPFSWQHWRNSDVKLQNGCPRTMQTPAAPEKSRVNPIHKSGGRGGQGTKTSGSYFHTWLNAKVCDKTYDHCVHEWTWPVRKKSAQLLQRQILSYWPARSSLRASARTKVKVSHGCTLLVLMLQIIKEVLLPQGWMRCSFMDWNLVKG